MAEKSWSIRDEDVVRWLFRDQESVRRQKCTRIVDHAWHANLEQGEDMITDLSEEVGDLLAVYQKAEKDLLAKEKTALARLTSHMKTYIDCQKEREVVSGKLIKLNAKLDALGEDEDE